MSVKKFLGGDIDEACNIFKHIETKSNFSSPNDLKVDFKTRFISHTLINQSLVDKHYTTNSESIIVCTTRLITLDPTSCNPILDIPSPTTEMYLKFPISNGEYHSTHKILSEST